MRHLTVIFFLAISFTTVSQQETVVSDFRLNSLTIYCPSYYFFDNVSPVLSPVIIGIKYGRSIKKSKMTLHVSTDYYLTELNIQEAQNLPAFGDVLSRNVVFFNLGLSKEFLKRRNFRLLYFGELNSRFGGETIYGGQSGMNWTQIPRDNLDIGVSAGISFEYRFKFGLILNAGFKQSFYYYVHDTYQLLWYVKPPKNAINLNLGFGWNFGNDQTVVQKTDKIADPLRTSHSIQLYSPFYYFFDKSCIKPFVSVGLYYSYNFPKNKMGLHLSSDYYLNQYSFDAPIYGSVLSREIVFANAGIDKYVVTKEKLRISCFGELNGRFGSEVYQTGYPVLDSNNQYTMNWTLFNKEVLDIGISGGIAANYRFKFGLTFYASVKQSVYYYVHQNREISNIIKPSRNVLNLNIGFGWSL